MDKFRSLGISEELVKAVEESGFKEPTEIQGKTIPLAVAGKDIIGGSATGSGKTFAFGASILDHVKPKGGVQALILSPTRELAEQIGKSLHSFSRYKPIKFAVVYGGVGISPQIDEISRAEIVVGTPGRILDHMERGTFKLDKIDVLVLDEADRMLDMGFIDDVRRIIEACPKERQTMLFSATINKDISYLAAKYMKNPVEVSVESYVDASKLEQIYYDVPSNVKFSLLVHLLKREQSDLVMVFCNTRMNSDFVANNLQAQGFDAVAIHGGLTQSKRSRIMESFHKGKVGVLVCTDVAARGLDVKGVSHVYNYDISKTSTEYVHRIGRTARAGTEGKAISIVAQRDYENFRRVLENGDIKITAVELPNEIEPVRLKIEQRRGGRRFGGHRDGGHSGGRGYGDRRGAPRRRY
jgi:ATP-dependent RNA helicase DeaD